MCRCGRMTYPRNYYIVRSRRTFSTHSLRRAGALCGHDVIVTMSCLSYFAVGVTRWVSSSLIADFGHTRSIRFSILMSNKISAVYLSKPSNHRFDGMYYTSERARRPVWVARFRHPLKRSIYIRHTVSLRYLVELVISGMRCTCYLGIFYYTHLREKKKNQTNVNIFKS